MWHELIGLCGTAFILVAFMFNNEREIRIFDTIGAVLFVVYGVIIGAYSNVILNGALIVIQLVKLHRMKENKRSE